MQWKNGGVYCMNLSYVRNLEDAIFLGRYYEIVGSEEFL